MKSAALVIRDGRQFHASSASITPLAPSTGPMTQVLVFGTLVLSHLLFFVPLQRNVTGHLSAGAFMNIICAFCVCFYFVSWPEMERENNKLGLLIHPLVWCFVSLQDI